MSSSDKSGVVTGTTTEQIGFAVAFAKECPHASVHAKPLPNDVPLLNSKCQDCENVKENWICLDCYSVKCGRHASRHMLAHNTQTTHPLVLGFDDLSFWCYACENYIDPTFVAELHPIYDHFVRAKFGKPAPRLRSLADERARAAADDAALAAAKAAGSAGGSGDAKANGLPKRKKLPSSIAEEPEDSPVPKNLPPLSSAEAKWLAPLTADLEKRKISGVVFTLTDGGSTLNVYGAVPIDRGSELNIAIANWRDANPHGPNSAAANAAPAAAATTTGAAATTTDAGTIKTVNRFPIRWIARHVSAPIATAAGALGTSDADLTEYADSKEVLSEKIKFLAQCIKRSSHFVVYTGAGISTAANIPDFRGPDGVWTRRDRGLNAPACIDMEEAIPTYSHRVLHKLHQTGKLKYLTSQNIDGLHRRSGIPPDALSELHGNAFVENCISCGAEYFRSFDVCKYKGKAFKVETDAKSASAAAAPQCVVIDPVTPRGITHLTGRKCDKCTSGGSGLLRDSIIHFSESLPPVPLKRAIDNSLKADVALVIGSSLRVAPANHLPGNCAQSNGVMFIINQQITGKDRDALRLGGCLIAAKCDAVLRDVMAELGLQVPEYEPKEVSTKQSEAAAAAKAALTATGSTVSAHMTTAIASYPKPRAAETDTKSTAAGADAKAPAAAAASSGVVTHLYAGNWYDAASGKWRLFVSSEPDELNVSACAPIVDAVSFKFVEVNAADGSTKAASNPPAGASDAKEGGLSLHFASKPAAPLLVSFSIQLKSGGAAIQFLHRVTFEHAIAGLKIELPQPTAAAADSASKA